MGNSYRLPLIEISSSLPGSNQSETYRHLMGLALQENAVPERIDHSSLPTAMIRLSPGVKAKLDSIAAKQGMDIRSVFTGLCAAGLAIFQKRLNKQAGIEKKIQGTIAIPFTPKSENQQRFYENIMTALAAGQIVFAEGSTGIGKSKAMVAAAIKTVQEGKKPVIIAAPTIAVMQHLYKELQTLDHDGISHCILPGASEFVDDIALNEYIQAAEADDSLEVDPEVREWIKEGAPSLNPDSPLARSIGAEAAWLMDDLSRISRNMPIEDFRLKGNIQEGGGEARRLLNKIREFSRSESDIIFCTHTMLAIGQQTQWRALPKPCVVIIDEAHLFERAVASVNNDKLSFHSLRSSLINLRRKKNLGKASAAAKIVQETIRLSKQFQNFGSGTEDNYYCLTQADPEDWEEIKKTIAPLRSLHEKLGSRALNEMRHIGHFRSAIKSILICLENPGRNTNRVDLVYSPDRRYPSLSCGPARVDMQLKNIWNSAEGGVVLSSATLYIMDAHGNSKCDYLRGLLAADFTRLSTPAPVIDKALYTLPTLYTLPEELAQSLSPPGKNTEKDAWLTELSSALLQIINSARGGTLVLLTAYIDIEVIADKLTELGVDKIRIVTQKANSKFTETEAQYRKAHADGQRPVMLALGTAWTGIDLKDSESPAETDTLLTDLVIPRLPVGLNKSNSMLARIERTGMNSIINECLLTFKQGVGRLIRRDGVKFRRLWILDGRIFSEEKWTGMESMIGGIRRFLKEYRHQDKYHAK